MIKRITISFAAVALAAIMLMSCSEKGTDGVDTTPPYSVLDLAVAGVSDSSVFLTWTATGDDGDRGRAAEYDIRYSLDWRDPLDWGGALQATDEPRPQPAGRRELMEIRGLSFDATYYFAIFVCDEKHNCADVMTWAAARCFVDRPVLLTDDSLEVVVRSTIHKEAGPLTRVDVEQLVFLVGRSRNIASLVGIDQIWNLEVASLSDNQISDLTPVVGLKKLRSLSLADNNISDLSPLATMDQIQHLELAYNPIADLSPITEMSNLQELFLEGCGLTDLAALVANPDIADGDIVGVVDNPLSQTAINEQIPALEARGVTVLR